MRVGVRVGLGPALTNPHPTPNQGERVRLAGWETWRLCQIQRARAEKAWGSVQREAEARGVSPALRRAWARVVAWNERTGASRCAIALARATASAIERAWARFAASGVARRLGALWQRTTIPRRLEELRQRAILQVSYPYPYPYPLPLPLPLTPTPTLTPSFTPSGAHSGRAPLRQRRRARQCLN